MTRRPPKSTLFPTPTLFRSATEHDPAAGGAEVDGGQSQGLGSAAAAGSRHRRKAAATPESTGMCRPVVRESSPPVRTNTDRKSTRLNSSHANISYAVFCLKK